DPPDSRWTAVAESPEMPVGPASFIHANSVSTPERKAMQRKRYNREEILQRVRKASADLAAGVPIEQVSAAQQVGLPTLKRWLRDFGTSPTEHSSRLKSLEQENRRLRRTVANLELDNKVLAEALRGNW